jgi:hypothetical protein
MCSFLVDGKNLLKIDKKAIFFGQSAKVSDRIRTVV